MIPTWKAGLAALAVASLTAAAASAATYRQPVDGRPAAVVDAPDDWTANRPQALSLNLTNGNHNGVISITIETVEAGFPLTSFRDNVFKAANCSAMDRAETVTIGGRAARAFWCQPQTSVLAPARVALVQVDPTHVLSVSHTYRLDASGADVQGLERVIAGLRIEP